MKRQTLVETGDVGLISRAYNLGLKLVPNLPHVIALDDLEYWERNISELKLAVASGLLSRPAQANEAVIREWESLYRELGISCDLSQVVIPTDPGGLTRVLIMAQGVMPRWVYDKASGLFRCWKWTDRNLDEVITSDRTAKNGSYAIRVRDVVEADEDLKNLSADDIKKQKINTETFEERIMHEIKFFKETGKHLDVKNVTLCAASRCSDGHVPDVGWGEFFGELHVLWFVPGVAFYGLRARRAVSN